MAIPQSRQDDEGSPFEPEDPESKKATLVEHLEELRTRIIRALLFVIAGWAVGWFAQPPVYAYLERILEHAIPKDIEYKTVFDNFSGPFMLKFKTSFILGLIIAGPIIIHQLWGFVKPALRKNELHAFRKVVPLSIFLFLLGSACAVVILEPAFKWFVGFIYEFQGAALFQAPGAFQTFILKMILAFGVGFQLPLVIWFLSMIGLLTSETLWKQWRVAVGGIILLTFVLTPGGDVFSNLMLGTPLLLMYFITILAVKLRERKLKKREVDAAAE
jgi:sec-independent protein translocase protein TatC